MVRPQTRAAVIRRSNLKKSKGCPGDPQDQGRGRQPCVQDSPTTAVRGKDDCSCCRALPEQNKWGYKWRFWCCAGCKTAGTRENDDQCKKHEPEARQEDLHDVSVQLKLGGTVGSYIETISTVTPCACELEQVVKDETGGGIADEMMSMAGGEMNREDRIEKGCEDEETDQTSRAANLTATQVMTQAGQPPCSHAP